MPHLDLANLNTFFLDNAELARRKLSYAETGTLHVTSGALVACDPMVQPEREPFSRRVAPGRYAVEIIAASGIPALLAVWLRDRAGIDPAALTWELALLEGQDATTLGDNQYFGYPVDTGLGCFMDADAGRAMIERQKRAQEGDGDFDNYYDAFVREQADADDVFEHWPTETPDGPNVMVCRSGWGDGNYPSYWALDPQGEPIALVTDFAMFENGDARSEDERADEAYLASLTPAKLAALEALQMAIEAGDADATIRLLAEGLAGANEIIPSSGGTALYEAIRLDQPAILTLLLGDAPCPDMPKRLASESFPDYLSYARRMHAFHLKKRKPRPLEVLDIVLRAVGSGEPPCRSLAYPSATELLADPAVTLMPIDALLERYALYRLRTYTAGALRTPLPRVAVVEGNLTLDNLDLEYPEDLADEQPIGFLVTGDLTITGNITNENTDAARGLVVLGNLHAGNIAIGGQELYVRGNLLVDGVFCGAHNHGQAMIDGNVTARLLIADDYAFGIGGRRDAPLAAHKEGDLPIHFVVLPELLNECVWPFNFHTLIARLRDGLPVIHPDCYAGSPKLVAWKKGAALFQEAEEAYWDDNHARAAKRYRQAEMAGGVPAICRYRQALCYYEDDEPAQAIPLLTWCIDNNHYVNECLVRRASALMMRLRQDERGKIDAAETYAAMEADCQRAIAGATGVHDVPNDAHVVEAYNLLGYRQYYDDEYEAALDPLARALAIDDSHCNANINMGKCLWHLDRDAEALPYLDKAIAADPDEGYPYIVKGHCHFALKNYPQAAEAFSLGLARDADNEWAHERLVYALVHLNRMDEALIAAERLYEEFPEHEFGSVEGVMASALYQAAQPEMAQDFAKRAFKKTPDNEKLKTLMNSIDRRLLPTWKRLKNLLNGKGM